MKRMLFLLVILSIFLASCSAGLLQGRTTSTVPPAQKATITKQASATPQPTASATPLPSLTPTPNYPVLGLGPTNFPAGVNPLTGLTVTNAKLLERRPVIVKVENLPRNHRPQWGLSQADLVYEYYTEEGTTRFAAVYYGQDAEMVGPVRSARHFDVNVIQMYKGVFLFGSAYEGVMSRLFSYDFTNRLVVEGAYSCPALCRYDPKGLDILMANTAGVAEFAKLINMDNKRPDLNGMFFKMQVPSGGSPAQTVYVRFSKVIYNRWNFDQASGRYLRFVDTQNADKAEQEVYAQALDRQNGEVIAADNVVILQTGYKLLVETADMQVWDAPLIGSGPATLLRDGQMYTLRWQRNKAEDVLTLVDTSGKLAAFKPGTTWFEVLGNKSSLTNDSGQIRFEFATP